MKKKQKRQIIINEDIDSSKFFELASTDKLHMTVYNLHELKKIF